MSHIDREKNMNAYRCVCVCLLVCLSFFVFSCIEKREWNLYIWCRRKKLYFLFTMGWLCVVVNLNVYTNIFQPLFFSAKHFGFLQMFQWKKSEKKRKEKKKQTWIVYCLTTYEIVNWKVNPLGADICIWMDKLCNIPLCWKVLVSFS